MASARRRPRSGPARALRGLFDVFAEAIRAQRAVERYVVAGRRLPEDLARRLNDEVFRSAPRR